MGRKFDIGRGMKSCLSQPCILCLLSRPETGLQTKMWTRWTRKSVGRRYTIQFCDGLLHVWCNFFSKFGNNYESNKGKPIVFSYFHVPQRLGTPLGTGEGQLRDGGTRSPRKNPKTTNARNPQVRYNTRRRFALTLLITIFP